MELQEFGVKKKSPPTYYYRNHHGKVISLTEEIALEQHKQHPEYFGSSDDLCRTGFDMLEMIASHLKKNVSNPKPPPDKRRVGNYNPRTKSDTEVQFLKNEVEKLKKIVNGQYNQEQKNQIQGSNGSIGTTPQGNAS